jgi:inward rectifier potassium channel
VSREPAAPRRATRLLNGRPIVTIGLDASPLGDAYHWLLTSTWRRFFLLVLGVYLAANGTFALAYLALGDAIENAVPGSFADAFFFSVQTMATIGYGKMAPRTLGANVLVTVEALAGLLGLALVTGVVFAKFARPTARVLFSDVAVVTRFDGVPSLLLRMANARGSQIAEASVHVVLLRSEVTAEGDSVRRAHELHLTRSRSAFFALTWTVIHPITPDSPLHRETAESLPAADVDLIVTLTGFDNSLAQTVHAQHSYRGDEVRWNHRFVDVVTTQADGVRVLDFRGFHDTVPARPEPVEVMRQSS